MSRRNNPGIVLAKIRSWIWVVGLVFIFTISLYFSDAFAATSHSPLTVASQQEIACPSEVELEIVELLNRERADENIPPLTIDMRLMEAARRHNTDMAANDFFSHTGSDGSSPGMAVSSSCA